MNNIIIVIPTLNEKENIKILFNKLTATNIAFDLLFIDDNSSDGSQEVIKDLVKKNQNINYIFRLKKMGIGSAHKDGLIWSYKKNYKIIITMDGDRTHDPKYIKYLIEKLKNERLKKLQDKLQKRNKEKKQRRKKHKKQRRKKHKKSKRIDKIQQKEKDKMFGITLIPDKNEKFTLTPEDGLIALARDES